ncbi:PH domain-containing protein [Epidermidibacterium keratini]|uniref:PH domain-containing protein n=1 Tax=Epidermidibacterium keratini TaxID=1891644 RepID=A0A7L4YJP8_9ACTN|nr:PH domain-containing protein [Epidermidibacterium keratini]QHB99073.1 PH domain-containing protein [Epidermidibacterium keratini]
MGFLQGLAGNMQQIDPQQAAAEYGPWLLEGEQVQSAYKMLRDGFCITNTRIISLDHQGATGKKTRVKSIPLHAIVDVTAESAGPMDDSEITLVYIETPRLRAPQVTYSSYTFEFPRKFDIADLYRYFMGLAVKNVAQLNAGDR